jgi:acyl-CoA thioesterase FadM
VVTDPPFTIVEEIVAPGVPGSHHHLVDYQTQELVSTLWSAYLAKVREGLAPSSVSPAMRRVSYSLESECTPGQHLTRAIRVSSRSRRSCTFEATLAHADDGRPIHVAEMVTVFVDPGQGAVEIPEDFWAAVERMEGRSIAVTERSRTNG